MADALAKYRATDTKKNALDRYKQAAPADLGALAKYLGLQGYWDRQGALAQGGLDQAEQGAQQLRNLNPMGAVNMLAGPANYLASPITALLPTEQEAYAARDLPEWSKPGVAGGLATMMAVMPGPKFKGLGKGMTALANDATDAERAALASRLETEAGQVGGAPSAVSRDEALANLTEAEVAQLRARMRAAEDTVSVPVRQYTPEELAKLRERLGPPPPPKKKEIPPIEDFLPKKRK